MSSAPDEILVQRQLRAAEIALASARKRRFETDEAVRRLQAEVADIEALLAANIAERERTVARAETEVRNARAAQLAAEQRYVAERNHRLEVEQELSALLREGARHDDLARQLAAEVRVRELEGELELVSRRAAEFEYGVRMAAFDAFKLVREMADRVGSVFGGVSPFGSGRTEVPPALDPAGEPDAPAPEPVSEALDSQRLDAALERLRASTPPPADER